MGLYKRLESKIAACYNLIVMNRKNQKFAASAMERKIKEIVFQFLDPKEYKVFLFGSRVEKGLARQFSDYDIGILGKKPVPFKVLAFLTDALEESDLPYSVDVVDLTSVASTFKFHVLEHARRL